MGAEPVRSSVRFPLRLAVTLTAANGQQYAAMTEDVSANGVLFVGDDLPEADTAIEFRLTMPATVMGGTDDVVLHCTGRIVRRTIGAERTTAAAVIDEYTLKAEQ